MTEPSEINRVSRENPEEKMSDADRKHLVDFFSFLLKLDRKQKAKNVKKC